MAGKRVGVIGGGMAGLTAAACLAQSGFEVDVFEQHYRLGGCCTSFKRRQYTWDAAVHAVGGCHEGGILRSVLEDLGIWDRVEMRRADPMDVVLSPHYYVPIWSERERFLSELRENFPREVDRLAKLVDFLYGFGPADFGEWANATYRDLLDHFLRDNLAKSVFMMPLGNIGISSRRVGAITACSLWRDNQLNGGYAPRGGFQALADAVGARIEELGGRVHPRTEVTRVDVAEGAVRALTARPMLAALGEAYELPCDYVVAAGAASTFYLDLVGREHLPGDFVQRLETLEPSFSGAVVFLGINRTQQDLTPYHGCHWYLDNPEMDAIDGLLDTSTIATHMFDPAGSVYAAFPSGYDAALAPPGKSTAVLILPAIYQSAEYWRENKERLGDVGVARFEKIVPGISADIEKRYVATSATIERFTRNHAGAWYGWAMTPEQSNLRRMTRNGPIAGAFLAGHWTQPGPGLLNVVKSGQLTAKAIRRDHRRRSRSAV